VTSRVSGIIASICRLSVYPESVHWTFWPTETVNIWSVGVSWHFQTQTDGCIKCAVMSKAVMFELETSMNKEHETCLNKKTSKLTLFTCSWYY